MRLPWDRLLRYMPLLPGDCIVVNYIVFEAIKIKFNPTKHFILVEHDATTQHNIPVSTLSIRRDRLDEAVYTQTAASEQGYNAYTLSLDSYFPTFLRNKHILIPYYCIKKQCCTLLTAVH